MPRTKLGLKLFDLFTSTGSSVDHKHMNKIEKLRIITITMIWIQFGSDLENWLIIIDKAFAYAKVRNTSE